MKSPKAEFIADKARVLKVRDMLADPDMVAALRTAFSQLCWTVPSTTNPASSWNNACKIEGAKLLLDTLTALPEDHVTAKTPSHALENESVASLVPPVRTPAKP